MKNFLDKNILGSPKNKTKINNTKLQDIIESKIPDCYLKLNDRKYYTTSFEEHMRFIEYSKVDLQPYIPEYHDCDDFAIALWGEYRGNIKWSGIAFGLMFVETPSYRHAINFFVDNLDDMYVVEPQTDAVWLIDDKQEWSPYFMMM